MRRAVSAACFAAIAVLSTPARADDADPSNHYILQCGTGCAAPQEVAIGAPHGITTDRAGNVYFAAQNVVFMLRRDGMLVRIAGTGVAGYGGDGGFAIQAQLNLPLWYPELDFGMDFVPLVGGLAVDGDGVVYLADGFNDRIRRIEVGGMISTLADAEGRPIETSWVSGLAIDAEGGLVIASWNLSRRAPDGTFHEILGWDCLIPPGDGACGPQQIAIDAQGAIHFPDFRCLVRKLMPNGTVVNVAGDPGFDPKGSYNCGNGGYGDAAVGTRLGWVPQGVALDRRGRLYIADSANHCIRRVEESGELSLVAGWCGLAGGEDLSGEPRLATATRLNRPMGVAVDADDNVFVADSYNRRVLRITPDGVIAVVAGNGN